jgi:hypothetical protein
MTPPDGDGHRDRKTALIVFGIIEVLFGAFCLLMIPIMVAGLVMGSHGASGFPYSVVILNAVGSYGTVAVVFIWLGIGSILCRRWARALWLCLTACWLCAGVIGCFAIASMASNFGQMALPPGQPPPSPEVMHLIRMITVVFAFVFYVVIPGALFLFYRSPNVKRTCEERDPVERWTDRCPLPVLALSLIVGAGAFVVLVLGATYGMIPLFGTVVLGAAGRVFILVFAGILAYLAVGLYRLKLRAWWFALGLYLFIGISNAVTLLSGDMGDLYTRMGFDSRTAAAAEKLSAAGGFRWLGIISLFPWFIWLLYIRRFFPRRPDRPEAKSEWTTG